jgi:hypothetical protein
MDRCPICNYRLRGLPARHRCPECGFAYDADTRVWRARGFGRFAGLWTVVCAMGIGAAMLGLSSNPSLLATLLLWAVILFCGLMGFGNVLLFRRRPFVALTHEGLHIREHWFTVRTVPWEQIGKIERQPNLGAGTLIVHDPRGNTLTTIGTWFTPQERDAFLAAAERLKSLKAPADS